MSSTRPSGQDRIALSRTRDLLRDDPVRKPSRDLSLAPLRRGVWAERDAIDGASRDLHHLARIEATAAMRPHAVFARESALALHGLPHGPEPDTVFTTGDLRTAGKKAGVRHSRVEVDPEDIVTVGGLLACSIPYALAELARKRDAAVAVAAIDAALHAGLTPKAAIMDALQRQGPHGRARACAAIAFADAASESVGESVSRVGFSLLGFPAPDLQPWVRGASGRRWRVDFRWQLPSLRRPLLGEFDGLHKYGALAEAASLTPSQALAKEKARDDDLRVHHDTAHWVWADAIHLDRLEHLLQSHGLPRERRRSLRLPPPSP